jgi:GNAT superfamily N-acetyltransferase
VVVADDGAVLRSSCVVVIVPNLTHSGRPYALVENVVTDEEYRCQGYATAVLDYAKIIAVREGCYKIMLMTGSKLDATLRFYERAGYNRHDKTAFIQWLE